MIVTPFRAVDLDDLDPVMPVPVSFEQAVALQDQSSWTMRSEAGKVLACAGVVPLWAGRYVAWAYMGRQSGRRMLPITTAVRGYLDALNARRVELTVLVNYEAAHRWAKLLGFTLETPCMPEYGPDGSDHAMYVRIKR